MQIYEVRINDKKNEAKMFWCDSEEERKIVTREQIQQGSKNICWEVHNIPTEVMTIALSTLRAIDNKHNKHTNRTPTKTSQNNSVQTQYNKIIVGIRNAFFACLVLLLLTALAPYPGQTYGEEKNKGDRWARLNRKAKELYGGYDVTVKVKAGLPVPLPFIQETDDNQNPFSSVSQGSGNGLFGKILLEIPLYSKDIRRKKESDKRKFLQDGYNYIKIINEGTGALEILKEKSMVLKAVMKDEGISSISAYYDALTEMVKLENEIREAGRNFETMVSR